MNEFVHGKNVYVRALVGATTTPVYVDFACATGMSMTVSTELIPATTVGNGRYRSYKPRLTDTQVTLTGITYIQKGNPGDYVTAFDTISETLRNEGLNLEITFSDEQMRTKVLRLFAWIPNTTINADVEDFSDFEITFQASGHYQIDDFITPSLNDNVKTYQYTATGGETSVSSADLVGRTLLSVLREAVSPLMIITSGTPGIKQVKFSSGAGRMDFSADNPLMPGENVVAFYK